LTEGTYRGGLSDHLPGFEELALERPPTRPGPAAFTIEIVRSRRRRRSVAAEMVDGVLLVTAPDWMSGAEAKRAAEQLAERFRRTAHSDAIDLTVRAATLARRYRLPEPTSIRWASNMARRWGSCTIVDRSVRVSDSVAGFPPWVLDYVIVHELAHLVVADHSPDFWSLVARYPRAELARGYLLAKAGR